jgi:hypothetical protein
MFTCIHILRTIFCSKHNSLRKKEEPIFCQKVIKAANNSDHNIGSIQDKLQRWHMLDEVWIRHKRQRLLRLQHWRDLRITLKPQIDLT